jgi:predicted short-subunit dehydrogenase-like oxidoreductase (DUF2520 family)
MGQGLGLALQRRGFAAVLYARSERSVATSLVLQTGDLAAVTSGAEAIIVAVPDDAVAAVAEDLARAGAVGRDQVVLHVSGLLDRTALRALDATGAGLGSLHPLQTIADPAKATERLQGVYAVIEGDDRAITAAERLARSLKMVPVQVSAAAKPRYHAGAVIAANYTVVLADLAERSARRADVGGEVAAKLYLPLLRGAVENLAELGPVNALTGPVRRGDVATIEAHLAVLEGEDKRVYVELARAALALARRGGLGEPEAAKVEAVLQRATGR